MEARMLGTCARKLSRRFLQQVPTVSQSFRCHRRRHRVLPTLLDWLVRPRDDEEDKRGSYRVEVLVRSSNLGLEFHRRFPLALGLKDANDAARLCHYLSRSLSSDATTRGPSQSEEKEKPKKATSSVEELPIAPDPQLLKVPKKQDLAQRARIVLVKIGSACKAMASMSREDWANQMKKMKKAFLLELQHYWLSGGKTLTRREQLQLNRTAGDVARLVPFIVIVIVPFMEFLLPVLLKVFPNMLPSTFQDKMKQEAELTKRLEARLQHARVLQNMVLEMADELKTKQNGHLQKTAKDLDNFMSKVRTGQSIGNQEILGFAKLFNDELTLDNISRPRLISMCKYMGLRPYGTDAYLRYALRKKLAWIKSDDRMIRSEGIDSLSEHELRAACRERGMLVSLTPEELKKQLSRWLELSLDHSMPSSLLILSRAFVPEKMKPAEAVQATLSSLPDAVVDSVGVTALPSEDTLEARKRKLEFLQQQEELIKHPRNRNREQADKPPWLPNKLTADDLEENVRADARRKAAMEHWVKLSHYPP